MINPDGVRHQIHGNVIQSTSRALMEEVSFDRSAVTSREWGAYPIITFPDVPEIDVLMLPRQDQPPLGVGESASVPSAAAIANAIFDATGVRFREPPFTPERILAGLRGEARPTPARLPPASAPRRRQLPAGGRILSPTARRAGNASPPSCTAVVGIAAAVLPWRSIAPIAPAGCVGLFGRDHRPRPATRRARRLRGLPHRPHNGIINAGGRPSRRRSAPSTAPTSRPMPRPASARGPIPPSSAPCATASIATAGISIRRFPIRILPRRPTPICRRSMPT